MPTNIEVDVKSSEEATYTWDAASEHTSFILKITAADNPENTWLSVYPQETKFEETQYRPDITYFYKLQGVCGEGKSEESGERSFTMLPKGQIKNFKCNEGDGTESTGFETIANQKLLERDLQVGDTFTYSNWCKISVKSVEKVGGYYKGKGVYRMPLAMFGFPLINIIFDSITVNTDLVALSGGFEAVTRGMAGVADVDEAVNTATNIVSNVQGIVQDVKQLVEDVKQELNALLETLQAGKNPTVEELETAKKDIDNLVVEGKKTLEELKKNPEENKEQIAKMEEAITKLESCSKCVDDHAKANKEEEKKRKEEATAKAGPNRYEIYNVYAIAAAECDVKEAGENGIDGAKTLESAINEIPSINEAIWNSGIEMDFVIVMVWGTGDGNEGVGHAAIDIQNYKEVTEKKKINEEWVTQKKYIADSTYIVRDLWPSVEVSKSNFADNVPASYSPMTKGKGYTLSQLKDIDITEGAEQRSADGLIKLPTTALQDKAINWNLDLDERDSKIYNGINHNCSDYVESVLRFLYGTKIAPTEEVANEALKITTPNQIYKSAISVPGAKIIKDGGNAVIGGSLEAITNDNINKATKKAGY